MSRAQQREIEWLHGQVEYLQDWINKLQLRLLTHKWQDYTHVLGYDDNPQRDYPSAPQGPTFADLHTVDTLSDGGNTINVADLTPEDLDKAEEVAFDMLNFAEQGHPPEEGQTAGVGLGRDNLEG